MGTNRENLRGTILENLTGSRDSSTYYADEDLNESIQDAYNEVVAKSKCYIKNTTISWQSGLNYYNPADYGIIDYLGYIAIFNNNSNLWLRDDVSIRDFNRIRRDWEQWTGEAQFLTSHSQKYFVICPSLAVGTGTFSLWYYATAPKLEMDTDTTIIANDMDILITDYVSKDMLESANEFTKASFYQGRYEQKLSAYKERTHNLAKHQLLLRI